MNYHPQMKKVEILNPSLDAASYNQAILDAEQHLRSLAEQCGGGSGEGGQTYIVAANSIHNLLITDHMLASRNINKR